ncbi:MAG: hypothetical protein B6D72_12890 [gamma proteobacterium symbiont of Ctena orbiculata]|uniref:Fibronectin type-III domain-containing protein n=1 Tax=Candidatus Thiodiazotropha taylori TaxID=2792791 RepID=A0A944M868_9GAMM|nr:hypothetical protein [Candidatus Thiodiazotropha taylori]MBV2136749.1 hypothetical protein [Candidatus Thiodiazotropha taylori]PUB82701.1 MAG: hypothetical protein DBP00_17010 [gamma proteobacterium symbiont of Ctena orbiculata]PVV10300.1 MAG: hypothetical protein B6D72_12890 [gamma proteobacterium symbiont of Ctena orbiculata]PVV20684.1 MAG: hypothetical protein B6D74_12640 [gamma proteobacterium symbiont of Ctena orbiculata]
MKQDFRQPATTNLFPPRTSLALLIASAFAVASPIAVAGDDQEIPFDDADIYAELNHTDGDLGFHALIDGEPWKRLAIEDTRERRILSIHNRGRLRRQGLTELFFESAEPPFDELTPAQFFNRFPEGIYEVEGRTLDNQEMESEVEFTHLMPAPAANIQLSGVPAAENCDADPLPVVTPPVVISWDTVTHSHPDMGRSGETVEVVRYQLVVEREEPTPLAMSIELPPDVTMMEVPSEFTDLGEEFKFEILVKEESGNQTAVESCFEVDG